MVPLLAVQVDLLGLWVHLVICTNHSYDLSDVLLISESLKDHGESWKLGIGHVVVPTQDWQSILWLEHKSNRRIVNYDDIVHWSA